jgi:SPP1 family predicted phage head-tail adaptor
MKTGTLRQRVSLQAEQRTSDTAGGYALAWTTLATVWANIKPITGKEVLAAGRLETRITHKITVRWRKDLTITPDMRALVHDRVFSIRAVINENESNRWATLLVEEGAAA